VSKTYKEHEAEIRYALSAYDDAIRVECAADYLRRKQASDTLHDKLAALLTDYRDITEVKP